MYEIKWIKEDGFIDSFYCQTKNCMNQIIRCEFYKISDKSNVFNFTFYITSKRKNGFQENKITGKDGIKSLIWAYKCLISCIEFLKKEYNCTTIEVFGDSKRKQKIYEYYLLPLGFKHRKTKIGELFFVINGNK